MGPCRVQNSSYKTLKVAVLAFSGSPCSEVGFLCLLSILVGLNCTLGTQELSLQYIAQCMTDDENLMCTVRPLKLY